MKSNKRACLTWVGGQYGVFVFRVVGHVPIMHDTAVIIGYAVVFCSHDFVEVEFPKYGNIKYGSCFPVYYTSIDNSTQSTCFIIPGMLPDIWDVIIDNLHEGVPIRPALFVV